MNLVAAKFNSLVVTGCGTLCAAGQGTTGGCAFPHRRKPGLLDANHALCRARRAFGSFAGAFCLPALMACPVGFVGAVTASGPPLGLRRPSLGVHTWGAFPVTAARAFTWLGEALSYCTRTVPTNLQHQPAVSPPCEWLWLPLALPFLLGAAIGAWVLRQAARIGQKRVQA